ncbi:hypothetical protein [Longitalea luteola]|uniref:hypothetical protein n=1 Tax=Longitalea luteola TaxID=2812563 RepID=UPI001A95AF25|nr:hypothetical protein [Longitalea luteola]
MKNIIIREYLESLTESEELDFIFPILLEAMNFKIVSTPKMTKGFAQYGKDVVAIGTEDGIKKRFYFEIKGGEDRHITTTTYGKIDGIRESIIEAMDKVYKDFSHPGFNELPIKIILVHNGIIRPNVKHTFDDFIEKNFAKRPNEEKIVFERWGIYELTELFATNLFNEYLLIDEEALMHLKKVLVLMNTPRNTYSDYFSLVNGLFKQAEDITTLGKRKRWLFLETLNLLSYIIFAYSKQAGNLEPAKKCLPYALLRTWNWLITTGLMRDKEMLATFQKQVNIIRELLDQYFTKTLPRS